jgi:AcrR family transcriptional regulator
MTRVVKEYDERYAEFLDVAQALFFSKGYERTSVKEIINAVGVAKGTFYYYFDSKVNLLEALVETLVEQLYGQVQEIVDTVLGDSAMSGAEKFEQLFVQIGSWKVDNPEFVRQSVRVYYQDENVLLRTKMVEAATEKMAPLFADAICQGVTEGSFDVAYPDEAARLVFVLNQTFSEAVVRMMLAGERKPVAVRRMAPRLETYARSVERVLGAEEGSLDLISMEHVAVWFD